ncbi:alpha/beta fold hydrolase [Candidatus Viridilinea mediisalina]|uniref:Alpha/beta hydrolase n=1 Tax=Candidatus Viridilinea mediisalina TaxID=2024553 RepID=A0A2A6RF23_9CHLR|nr:alpha/beta hydrolase [Candidatus Viridilinea mediisalina]PDW01541.1 alpha/beta hydrolase [Candidatus Viridilinea mediisalina]
MPSITTRHGSIHYLEVGTGRPLVLLHGNTYSANTQVRLAARFSDEHRVISPDLLGHGQSARPTGLFSTRYFAMQGEALADLLTSMFSEAVPVFGMSAGGISALNAICLVPERISALILDGVFRQVTTATVDAHHHSTANMTPAWHRYMAKQHGEAWWPILNASIERTIEHLAVERTVVAPCLAAISVPTIVFHGGQDPFVPDEQARMIVQGIRGARLVYEAAAGHLLAWRNPATFRERVRRFVHEGRK